MKKYLKTISICAVLIGLLCMTPLLCDKAHAKDPYPPDDWEAIYLKEGFQSFSLNVQKKYPDMEFTYSADSERNILPDGKKALAVEQSGLVTMLTDRPGNYVVYAYGEESGTDKQFIYEVLICIELKDQTLIGPTNLKVGFGKTIKLNVKAKTHVRYRSDTPAVAKVDSTGVVTFLRPGKALIVAVAESDDTYKGNGLAITITSELEKPSVKATPRKGKVKLRWTKVTRTQKYLIYVKYPGKKKYKLAATKSALVKGITHKNLKKGKKYSYKIRAYMKLDGKEYYSPYSKAVTVRVRR